MPGGPARTTVLPLNIDTTTAIRRPADQQALVQAVLAADPTDETAWLEWKSRVDLAQAEGRFTVAKGILGLANRHPDHAARTMEGCGYLLVGVEPSNLVGLARVDGADLDNQLRQFLGQKGPQWSPTWIPVNGTHVLLVTVDPPRWGDPIHVLHRDYGRWYAGTVFVRRGSSTVPANPVEMAELQDRVVRRSDQVRIELTLPTSCRIQPIDLCEDELDAWLLAERQALLAPMEQQLARRNAAASAEGSAQGRRLDLNELRRKRDQRQAAAPILTLRDLEELAARRDQGEELTPADREQLEAAEAKIQAMMATSELVALAMGYQPEERTPKAYISEVEAHLAAARAAAVDRAMIAATREGVGRLQLVAANPTDRNFTNILVEVQVDAPIRAVDAREADDLRSEPELPARPRRWGARRRQNWLTGLVPRPALERIEAAPLLRNVSIEQGPPCRMQWRIDHLPPRGRTELAPVSVLIGPEHAGQTVVAQWTATARDADGVVTGTLPIAIDTTPAAITPLAEQTELDQAEG